MTTPTIDLIHRHGSVRKYKPDPVPKKMVEIIISAGQCASTSSNLQMFSVVAVSDLETRTHLQELCGGQKHIGEAPVFLAWCADLSRLDRVCKLTGYEQESDYVENFLLAVVDASLASQNSVLASESLGLGICYIGGLRTHPQQVMDLLQTPRLVFPLVGMTLGWPRHQARVRPRLPLNAVLHWNKYNHDDQVYLEEYDKTMIATGIYKDRQIESDQDKQISYGWMEHSARRISQAFRIGLREVLVEIGYLLK